MSRHPTSMPACSFARGLYRAIGLAGLAIALATPVAAEERCYGDWSDAALVVAAERLRSARDVHDLARAHLGGDVVRIVLCRVADDYVYRVVLRRADGRIGNLTVSAASLALR